SLTRYWFCFVPRLHALRVTAKCAGSAMGSGSRSHSADGETMDCLLTSLVLDMPGSRILKNSKSLTRRSAIPCSIPAHGLGEARGTEERRALDRVYEKRA